MKLRDLSRDERNELKMNYLCTKHEQVSWGEIADAEILVSMAELEEEYGGTEFVKEDFFCNLAT